MRAFRALAIATVVALYAQIVLGGIVRVTGSGEACTGWPLCSGHIIPAFDYHVIIEYSHRSVGFLSICLVTGTMLASWWVHKKTRRLRLWAEITFLLVVVQAVLGGITVLLHLPPTAILLHLGNAMLVLASALVVAVWSGRVERPVVREASDWTVRAIVSGAVGAFAIMLSGAYVVGAGASAACTSWPLCGAPGGGAADIHMLHRIVVGIGTAAIVWAAIAAGRRWTVGPLRVLAGASVAVVALQAFVGRDQVLSGLPQGTRALHLALATMVWAISFIFLAALWLERPRAARSKAPERLAGAAAG